MSDRYEVWTDGAAEANGRNGPGGWAYIIRHDGQEHVASGFIPVSSCNISEMTAAIEALKVIPAESIVLLHTDSKYLLNGITSWIFGWKEKGWLTQEKQPVKNKELWEQLDELDANRCIEWQWVPGHRGIAQNERCDALAVAAIKNGKFGSNRIQIPALSEISA